MNIVFTTLPYIINHKKYFPITFVVAGGESEEEKRFSPGLNKLFDTFNVVTDTEPRVNEPDKDIFELEEEIKDDLEDNDRRGYYVGDIPITFSVGLSRDLILKSLEFYDVKPAEPIEIEKDLSISFSIEDRDLILESLDFHDI